MLPLPQVLLCTEKKNYWLTHKLGAPKLYIPRIYYNTNISSVYVPTDLGAAVAVLWTKRLGSKGEAMYVDRSFLHYTNSCGLSGNSVRDK
jgi:hypothetical protein